MRQLPKTKTCTNCKKRKRASAFYRNGSTLRSRCIECHKKISLAYKALNPEHRHAMNRNANLLRLYGIGAAEYDRILAEQNGVCAVCGKNETAIDHQTSKIRRLSVDHCHATKKIGGLLCRRCNTSLGKLEESPELIASLLRYVTRRAR